jgi:hypothetical protein
MDLEVVIEGVPDARVVKAITRKIHEVCDDGGRSGSWSVLVSPSETRGQWDLGVKSPAGRSFSSFRDRDGTLPDLVAAQLRACL